ncbi:hypothetical protein PIB30_115596, partial [Stylosanthes scabra]|nr:hypothetical protein [Stylosanthes scabra]
RPLARPLRPCVHRRPHHRPDRTHQHPGLRRHQPAHRGSPDHQGRAPEAGAEGSAGEAQDHHPPRRRREGHREAGRVHHEAASPGCVARVELHPAAAHQG